MSAQNGNGLPIANLGPTGRIFHPTHFLDKMEGANFSSGRDREQRISLSLHAKLAMAAFLSSAVGPEVCALRTPPTISNLNPNELSRSIIKIS